MAKIKEVTPKNLNKRLWSCTIRAGKGVSELSYKYGISKGTIST